MLGRLLADTPAEKLHRQTAAARTRIHGPKRGAGRVQERPGGLHRRRPAESPGWRLSTRNRNSFHSSADIVLIWCRFIDHGMQWNVQKNMKKGGILIRFDGHGEGASGLKGAITEIERALRR